MPMWRYIAIPLTSHGSNDAADSASRERGELAGASAADVRAALRRIGLQPIKVTPLRRSKTVGLPNWTSGLSTWWQRHQRRRRRSARSEMYDSMATMVESGMPLLEVLSTLSSTHAAARKTRSAQHRMIAELLEQVRSGMRLHDAMAAHPHWFSSVDMAMIEAGHRGGRLPSVLRALASREERCDALNHKLIAALTYPSLITTVAIGVTVFLSTRTLPDLTSLLIEADLDVPGLTIAMMSVGQWAARFWLLILVFLMFFAISLVTLLAKAQSERADRTLARLTPTTIRRKMIATTAHEWAALVASGVPVSESLHILQPTVGGGLRHCLGRAATRLEDGADLATALDEPLWFDPEFRRMLQIGQDAGELEVMLGRVAARYERQTDRLIERAAALLEPVAILLLAVLVGTVVMAAILPLLRLQEMI